MSFSLNSKTLRSDETYNQVLNPKMLVNAANIINASESYDAEEINGNSDRILPELIDERLRCNLEPLNQHISTLTQLLKQLVQDQPLKLPQRWVSYLSPSDRTPTK